MESNSVRQLSREEFEGLCDILNAAADSFFEESGESAVEFVSIESLLTPFKALTGNEGTPPQV